MSAPGWGDRFVRLAIGVVVFVLWWLVCLGPFPSWWVEWTR